MVAVSHLSLRTVGVSGGNQLFVSLTHITNTFAHAGVDIFFVVSGAIMFMITQRPNHATPGTEVADFLFRRFVRIYPLLWVTLVFSLLSRAGVAPTDLTAAIRSLLLIDMPPAHPVAWTLVFEIRFYVMVGAIILLFRNHIATGFIFWAFFQVALIFFTQHAVIPFTWGAEPIMIEFIFGVAVGALVTFDIVIAPRAMIVLGIAWFVATMLFVFPNSAFKVDTFRMIGYGFPSAMILYGMISLKKTNRISIPSFIVKAGDASYSVYLWQLGIFSLVSHLRVGGAIGFVVMSIVCLAIVGQISFLVIERPLMRLARRLPWRSRRAGSRVVVLEGSPTA